MRIVSGTILMTLVLSLTRLPGGAGHAPEWNVELRRRLPRSDGNDGFREVVESVRWNPHQTAVIVCDMWDDHTCKAAAARVAEMAPAVDQALRAARKLGAFIIHAPSGTMAKYQDTPPRRRAQEAPRATAPVEIKWNYWDEKREGKPLADIVDGGCSCETACSGFREDEHGIRKWMGGTVPWTRQIATIEIAAEDAVSDNGQEIYYLLQQRGIGNVIVLGVHTNICVSGRPFGLRQLVYLGKNVVLCRDLTDSLFQSPSRKLNHFRGTELIIAHIETRICPSITSTSLTGKPAFRFRE